MMNRILHITYSTTEDCQNEGGAYGGICTRCNKCGRWGEIETHIRGEQRVEGEGYSGMKVHFSSEKDGWKTPSDLLENYVYRFAPVDLDPCCSDKHVKARQHYTETENGLKQPWEGICFMNPPYGREIGKWCEKAADEADRGAVVIGLLPARVDTRWFHEQVFARAKAVVFVKGRLRFEGAPSSAPFPSCLVLWADRDDHTARFRDVFGELGECMC